MDQLIGRLGTASARRPWATIATWAVLTTVVVGLAGVAAGAFADDLTAPGSESERAFELLEEAFPAAADASALAVFAAPEGEVLADHADAIATSLDHLAGGEHVAHVADPFTAGAVSADGRIGFATVAFDVPVGELGPEPVADAFERLTPAREAGLVAEMGGEAAFLTAEAETSGAEGVGLLAALVVLVVAFGAVVAALVPIVLALVAVAVGLGGIALLANAMEVSSAAPTIAAMIGLGVGIDYALFVVARYREECAKMRDEGRAAMRDEGRGPRSVNQAALTAAMRSSGTAVVLAGGTVVVAMAALALTGLGFLASIGFATSLVVLVAVLTALTLLPALLTLLGDRIDTLRVLGRRPRRGSEGTRLWAFAHRVAARPLPHLVVAALVLLALAVPALSMETGFPDAGDDGTDMTHRRAYDLLAEGFGPGFNGPFQLVVDLSSAEATAGREADLAAITAIAAGDPGIASVGPPQASSPDGRVAVLPAIPTTAPADPQTATTLARVRDALPEGVAVAGLTAMTVDLTAQLDDVLPLFVGAVLLTSILLLLVVFRSVAVPLKAAVMNLLSIGGAYGIVVAVFQWGWGASLLGLDQTHLVASPMPVMFFAVLFGLSMDYEVFLLSRIREEYVATGDNAESVARGMAATGRVITAAALIMTAVFLGFVANPSPMVKMMGLGLSTAILLDATIVRLVVAPAAMALMGDANWWLPRWLDRLLPHVGIEGGAAASRAAVGAGRDVERSGAEGSAALRVGQP